jgi:hypothetical protein
LMASGQRTPSITTAGVGGIIVEAIVARGGIIAVAIGERAAMCADATTKMPSGALA